MIAHGGCNWEGCKECFPHLQNKPLVTDEDHFNRAAEIANGDYMRYGERINPIAVARHAVKLLKR